jgi:DNA-binding NarL/FixJ family response regulator
MAGPIRVIIADDEPLLRDSFRVLINSDADCAVVGEAADGVAAVQLAATKQPDVMLMDIRMPNRDGLAATRIICGDAATTSVRVLILTMFDLDPYVYSALSAGASGFLLKDIAPGDLLNAIKVVATGHALFAPTVTRRLIAQFNQPSGPSTKPHGPMRTTGPDRCGRLADLTNREREILALVASGLSNAQICDREHISMGTVKTHLSRLLAKLGARDRAQLVIAAYESGLVSAGVPALTRRVDESTSTRSRPPRQSTKEGRGAPGRG